ncbi:hypothetical protein [Streptomyces sp. NPDC056468]|uniref:hypothetical protein n=1 Tax=Streptomyces sp. NPDC056468 TaxID=3345830 RepID=UPI00369A370F
MNAIDVLFLLLAISFSVNVGGAAGWLAACAGMEWARAVLLGGGAAGTTMALVFAGAAAFR